MFRKLIYNYCMFYFVLQVSVNKNVVSGTNETVKSVHTILDNKSWGLIDSPIKSIAYQQIFFEENHGQFKDIIGRLMENDSVNIDEITSTMYVALGCKCGETIKDILTLLFVWLINEEAISHSLILSFIELNKTVLKTISVMINFIDIAPNVLSIEPGILKMAILINLNLNYSIETHEEKNGRSLTFEHFARVIFQMINLLERYTISDCTSMFGNQDLMIYTNIKITEMAPHQLENKTQHLISHFEELLQNTGIPISNFRKYNITKIMSNELSPDEDSLKFNIIVHVLNQFNFLIGKQQSFLKASEIDIDTIFVHQNSMYQLIMLIVHNNIAAYLLELKQNEDTPFLDKTNIWKHNLIEFYKALEKESIHLKFPTNFVNQIQLILEILNAILNSIEIDSIDYLIDIEKYQSASLSEYLGSNTKSFDSFLMKYSYSKNKEFQLHMFLKEIISIKHIVYFNQFFNLLRNDMIEPKNEAYEDLNKIQFFTDLSNADSKCGTLDSVYAYSYRILVTINREYNVLNPFPSSMKSFNNILSILRSVIMMENQKSFEIPLSYNVIYAEQYLSYNLIKFPLKGLNVKEKCNRMIYLLLSFIDRHHILNCNLNNYRDVLFNQFKSFISNESLLLDIENIYLSSYISNVRNTLLDDELATQFNLENFVLFNGLVKELHFKETQLNLYWNGQLKSIHHVRDYINVNLFNFSSIQKYINVFFEWLAALLSHTVLKIVNLILIEDNNIRSKVHEYDEIFLYKYVFKKFFYNGSAILETFFNEVSKLCIFHGNDINDKNLKARIWGLKIMLENYLKIYNSKFRLVGNIEENQNLYSRQINTINEFHKIFKNVEKLLKVELNGSCKIRKSSNPLIFVFADYLNFYRIQD